jgi:hypothetical protein
VLSIPLYLDVGSAVMPKDIVQHFFDGQVIILVREAGIKVSASMAKTTDEPLTWLRRGRHLLGIQPERRRF